MKRFTRIVSVILACAMAMCLLTACGGGGGGTSQAAKDQAYVTNLGASASIKRDTELTAVVEELAKTLDSGSFSTDDQLTALQSNFKGKYTDGVVAIELKDLPEGVTAETVMALLGYNNIPEALKDATDFIIYFSSENSSFEDGYIGIALNTSGALKSAVSDMTAYGTASGEISQDSITLPYQLTVFVTAD